VHILANSIMNSTPTLLPSAPPRLEGGPPARVYRMPPDAVQVYQSRALAQLLPVLSIALFAGLLVGSRGLPGAPLDFAIAGLMLLGLLVVGSATILRLTRRAWEGYELHLAGDTLIQRSAYHPEIRLQRQQVASIQEHPGRSLVVRSAEQGQDIHIPAGIEGYAGLRSIIASWAPVEGKQAVLKPD
jgi:hypothetical protein